MSRAGVRDRRSSKDVMVRDAGRHPARDRPLPARARRRARRRAASRRSSASRRTTRPSGATREIADFFVPHGLRRRAAGPARPPPLRGHEGVLPQRDAAHRARTATTRSSGSPRSRGRTAAPAWSAARTRAITQVRTALERAAAPDRDLARRRADEQLPPPDARGRRDAAAHVLGALHPRRRRAGRAGDPEQAGGGLGRPAQPAAALLGVAVDSGPARAPARAGARRDAR